MNDTAFPGTFETGTPLTANNYADLAPGMSPQAPQYPTVMYNYPADFQGEYVDPNPMPILPRFDQSHTSPGQMVDDFRRGKSLYQIYQMTNPYQLTDAIRRKRPLVDFVEEGSERVLLRDVPKKMLEIFLGPQVLSEFICALEVDASGEPIREEIRVPQFSTSHIALKIMVAWMLRACRQRKGLREMAVPENLFAAITLARTLRLFGRDVDAWAADYIIMGWHYRRSLSVAQLKPVWNFLPKDSRHISQVLEVLKFQLYAYSITENPAAFPQFEALRYYVLTNPDLRRRVYGDNNGTMF
jgi:hypothetical protein